MEAVLTKKDAFLECFEGHDHNAPNGAIKEVFAKSRAALAVLDFPTRRTEEWKYSPVAKLVNHQWKWQEGTSVSPNNIVSIPNLDAYRIVLVNGKVQSNLNQLPNSDGITVCSMGEAMDLGVFQKHFGRASQEEEHIFSALNGAYAQGGVFIHIAKNKQLDKPLLITHLAQGEDIWSQSRHLMVVEEGAEVQVIQHFQSEGENKTFGNHMLECFVGENAKVSWDKIQSESNLAVHISTEYVVQRANSNFKINTLTPSGAWVRNNLYIRIKGEGCETHLNGAYAPRDKQHVDNRTEVDHLVPNCESHELYKGIVYDKATAVFNGKVFVRPDAQHTNAYQQNANILMSDDATANSKPELEIYADDVQCSHGSVTGQFDEEAVFYLKARGLSDASARQMLVGAFLGEVFEKMDNKHLKEFVEERFV